MTSGNLIGDRPGDVKRLAAEVAELKGVLRDISQQIRRIERRIDAVLPAGKRLGKSRKTNGAPHSKKHVAVSETVACACLTRVSGLEPTAPSDGDGQLVVVWTVRLWDSCYCCWDVLRRDCLVDEG